MIWTVTEEQLTCDAKKNAGGKARNDVRDILLSLNVKELFLQCPQLERQRTSGFKKILFHYSVMKEWNKLIKKFNNGDVLVLQFPVINHTLFLNGFIRRLKKRGVEIVAVIHDLELLRLANHKSVLRASRFRMKKEELDELKEFDSIIVHNKRMKDYMINCFGISKERLVILGIFDYLIPSDIVLPQMPIHYGSCIIAGNLRRDKSQYIYRLPDKPLFELYGVNYEGNAENNIHYNGSFLPEELVEHLVGGFGLVWDGDSPETCSGAWGEYLKYNNPHKTSLYLASGIPVIIWKEAALAEFVETNNVGLTISSLYEIDEMISKLTKQEYETMRMNARNISQGLREGYYIKNALNNALNILKG